MRHDDPAVLPLLPLLARVGDTIETEVQHPQPGVIRATLRTLDSCASGNALLLDPTSGWRLVQGDRTGGD